MRGVSLELEKKSYIDIFGRISEMGSYGIVREEIVNVYEDSIKIKGIHKNSSIYVYIKQNIKNDSILNFKADW